MPSDHFRCGDRLYVPSTRSCHVNLLFGFHLFPWPCWITENELAESRCRGSSISCVRAPFSCLKITELEYIPSNVSFRDIVGIFHIAIPGQHGIFTLQFTVLVLFDGTWHHYIPFSETRQVPIWYLRRHPVFIVSGTSEIGSKTDTYSQHKHSSTRTCRATSTR